MVAAEAQKRKGGVGVSFRNFTAKQSPTNHGMLIFRTVNRDLLAPNANADYIAPLFRDKLMPIRGWLNRHFSSTLTLYKSGVEDPEVGLPGVCNFVDARTKWFDAAVKEALDDGCTQVVCIAAGFDTRAYRFCRPGVEFFEIDLPSASKKKQALVASCLPPPAELPRPTYVAADLSEVTLDAALDGTGFSPSKKTLFTMEGLIYYLPPAAVQKLVASVAALAAPGSRLCFDFLHQAALDAPAGGASAYPGYDACSEVCRLKGEPFLSGFEPVPEAMGAYLQPLGWLLHGLWSPREMVAAQLPHLAWSDALPPILSFYSYAEARKPELGAAKAAAVPRKDTGAPLDLTAAVAANEDSYESF